jgi:antibiotic biosynthesis monooxygenase (ABM) superfamily enzyme
LFPTESSVNFRFVVLISFSAWICCPDRILFLQISLREAVRKISKNWRSGLSELQVQRWLQNFKMQVQKKYPVYFTLSWFYDMLKQVNPYSDTSSITPNIFLGSVGPRSYCGIGIITLFPTESSLNFRCVVLISFSAWICCPERADALQSTSSLVTTEIAPNSEETPVVQILNPTNSDNDVQVGWTGQGYYYIVSNRKFT